jgi:hypothetical protein
MDGDRFTKVFDVVDAGFRNWMIPSFGLVFVAVGLVLLTYPRLLRKLGIAYLGDRSKLRAIFPWLFFAFAVLWTMIAFSMVYFEYRHHLALVREDRCQSLEGMVENFVPMPYSGHANETFTVKGVAFGYSDYTLTNAFNNTSSHGGPINSSSYVRICYDPRNHAILRLEIRDFRGEFKDYSKTGLSNFLPRHDPAAEELARKLNVRWVVYLFVALGFLDLLVIQAMFLPYLRTFIPMKSVAVRDGHLSSEVMGAKTFKLRNSVGVQDPGGKSIWIRARGYNFIRNPMMVARLAVDNGAIASYQLRFSSGQPLVVALFLWTVYRHFIALSTVSAQSIWLPPLIIGVLFVIGAVASLGSFATRMEKIVDDALAEMRETKGLHG